MSDFFNEHYKQYDAWYDRNKAAYLSELEAVKKALPKEGYGLEIGVGSGRFAAPLGIAVGVDPSKKMVELARKRGVDARLGSGESLSFKDSTFDYIAIIVTLCFVRDPGQVIGESARVLKDRGRIIIGIVDKDSFLGELYRNKKSVFYEQAHFFSVREVIAMLKGAGFDKFSYYQTLFDLPDRMNFVVDPQKGYGKGGFVVVSGVKCR
jgi:ubiquinone/menaquinone biosynthesis C-methylase UbiE